MKICILQPIDKVQLQDTYEMQGEDLTWCQRVKELNYKIYLDNDVKIGHCGMVAYE